MKIGDKEYTEIIIHDDYENKLFTIMDDGIQFEENIGDDYHAEFVPAASNFEPQCGECSRRKWYQKGYEDAKREKWIAVSARLPEDYQMVLTCDDYDNMHIMFHHKDFEEPFGISCNNPRLHMVAAWMPLPEPYKEDAE